MERSDDVVCPNCMSTDVLESAKEEMMPSSLAAQLPPYCGILDVYCTAFMQEISSAYDIIAHCCCNLFLVLWESV